MPRLDPFEFVDPVSGRRVRIQPIFTSPGSEPSIVRVRDVIACVSDSAKWFLVRLESGELTVAHVDVRSKRWTAVPESQWPSIPLNGGLPEKYETVKCPVCSALVDVMFPCSKHVDELVAECPACGYTINVEQAVYEDSDDGGIGER